MFHFIEINKPRIQILKNKYLIIYVNGPTNNSQNVFIRIEVILNRFKWFQSCIIKRQKLFQPKKYIYSSLSFHNNQKSYM